MGSVRDVVRAVAVIGCAVVAGCAGAGPSPSATTAGSGPTTIAPSSPSATPSASLSGTPSASPSASPAPSPGTSPAPSPAPNPPPVPAPVSAPTAVPAEPAFTATASPITPELAVRMTASWREGCPVPLEDLRYLTLTYRGFDGLAHAGELVVHADSADAITQVFRTLFEVGYPIRSLRLVDDFGADDDASMAADNTSAFNCRTVAGTSTWSQHAYGRAIDLNPVENPYVSSSGIYPPEGRAYASRPDLPGVLHAGDPVVRAFATAGWPWGGGWSGTKDYQHFSATGQ